MAHLKQFQHLKIQLEAIKIATNNFADESCIGRGGFGKVYKGKIAYFDGHTMVALKRLDRAFGQGDPEFWKEIMMLSLYKHENIVSLLGFCDDCGEKILVYQYVPNKSLDLYLDSDKLTWIARLKICIGAACGLAYLHSGDGTQQRVLHRDIKSSNILLDEDWNAKISDFGLSKFGPANQEYTFLFSNAVGTFGYCDPLYQESGLLTKESDVYSFGVVLFEVLCGRLCIDNKNFRNRPLIGLARQSYEENKIKEIVYDNIKDEINPECLQVFATIAYQCLNRNREERPLMSDVATALATAFQYQCLKPPRVGSRTEVMNALTSIEVKRRKSGILNVKNIGGRIDSSTCNLFVTLRLSHTDLQPANKTTVKHKERYPVWNEEFNLNVENIDVQSLHVTVMSQKSVDKLDFIGQVGLEPRHINSEHPKIHDHHMFPKNNLSHVGKLKFETVYKPMAYNQSLILKEYLNAMQKAVVETHECLGLLVVLIHGAKYLSRRSLSCSPYATLLFRGELRKTKTIKKDRNPEWKEEFTYMLDRPPRGDKLRLEVFSAPWLRCINIEESLGCVDIDLAHVVDEKRIIDSYKLKTYGKLDVELEWRISDQITPNNHN